MDMDIPREILKLLIFLGVDLVQLPHMMWITEVELCPLISLNREINYNLDTTYVSVEAPPGGEEFEIG